MKLWHIAITLFLAWALIGLSLVARAETYNPEDKWIGKAIRKQIHEHEDRAQPDPPRRYYDAPRRYYDRDKREIEYARDERRHSSHPETRVYGVTIRRLDATGSVGCYPAVEAYSVEANTEDGAWVDAQRNFENQVRAMYGERWLEIKNARDIEKQCWASSGNQSMTGRVAEKVGQAMQAMTGNEGGIDGRKHRCRVLARPCQAPKDIDPATKGDPKL